MRYKLANEYFCASYSNINELLNNHPEIDVISVCTPNGLHAKHTIIALKNLKHVLCEKPMALTTKDCKTMIKTAEEEDRKLFIVKQNRYNPPIVELKKAIDEGTLGTITNVQLNCFWNRPNRYYEESDWKGTNVLDGGTLFTQFSHFIDLLIWLIGDIDDFELYRKNFQHKNVIEFDNTGVII